MLQTTKSERIARLAGFTLVELMVSLFIVGIVMLGWWRIMNATSPYREAQRRAAVEVAAGMLDIVEPDVTVMSGLLVLDLTTTQFCRNDVSGACHAFPPDWFPPESPVRYTLRVVRGGGGKDWQYWNSEIERFISADSWWLNVTLYDSEIRYAENKAFASLSQLIMCDSN